MRREQRPRFLPVEHRRSAFLHHMLGPAHGMRRVDLDHVADHQPVEQHAQRREVLFDRGPGQLPEQPSM